jgi:hypothetical protein
VPTNGSTFGCTTCVNATIMQNVVNDPATFYVNVHNVPFGGGAMRGQLGTAPALTHIASLSGAAEFPGPGDPERTGVSTLTIDVPSQRICIATRVQDISTPTMAHIHSGAAGAAGGIVVDLQHGPGEHDRSGRRLL